MKQQRCTGGVSPTDSDAGPPEPSARCRSRAFGEGRIDAPGDRPHVTFLCRVSSVNGSGGVRFVGERKSEFEDAFSLLVPEGEFAPLQTSEVP